MIELGTSITVIDRMATRLRDWHRDSGRHDLPWQRHGPYATWVSEIMLQQTQVAVVIPYYLRFIESFPSVTALAEAPQDQVLAHWAGLGYYARARNLHQAAQQIVSLFDGEIPQSLESLMTLKGIGRSTAGAIRSLGWGLRGVIQDGNVRRVLARLHAIAGDLQTSSQQHVLWELAEYYTPALGEHAATHTQAMMDLGATVCKRTHPRCSNCPFHADCQAHQQGLTDYLPTPKKVKKRPSVEWFVLGLRDINNRIWVTRRPDLGIWGGLYCPPTGESLQQLIAKLNLPADLNYAEGPVLAHVFSHFSVQLSYIEASVPQWNPPSHGIWVTQGTYDIGLPAPINRLLGWV